MSAEKNIWKDGVMGVVVGDALGCPVQFVDRAELAKGPVDDMEGYGTYNMPEGTWTDDSSMTLATLISIQENGNINLPDIMYRFVLWLTKGEYTPFGQSFDIGGGTLQAITRYIKNPDVKTCGGTTARDNGNGSLMRIMPVCLYCYEEKRKGGMTEAEAVRHIHEVSGLTHNHLRAKIACGLYYFMVTAVLDETGSLAERLQKGIDAGFAFYKESYKGDEGKLSQLYFYNRLRNLDSLAKAPESAIRSSGYVVDTIEASVWSLITTDSFKDALLKAVNLGDDSDTIGAIAGGLAGLYYGYDAIPEDWLAVIKKRDWVERLVEDGACSGSVKNREQSTGDEQKPQSTPKKKKTEEPKMNRRAQNVLVFEDTLDFINHSDRLLHAIVKTRNAQKIIFEGDPIPEIPVKRDAEAAGVNSGTVSEKEEVVQKTRIIVSGKRTLEAASAYKSKKVCVLNFASSTNPGGGVIYGSSAQEESICRCSTLYLTLTDDRVIRDFYKPHKKSKNPLYNDDLIYSPDVWVIKSDTDMPERLPEEEWYSVNVITCAAPNLRDHPSNRMNPNAGDRKAVISEEELSALLEKRIRRIFAVAANEGTEVLVLGAFGCGAFENPPKVVAKAFHRVMEEYPDSFETIEYAVFHKEWEKANYEAFVSEFREYETEGYVSGV